MCAQFQERLDAARQAVSEAKKQSGMLAERFQALEGERTELELRKEELEGLLQQQEEVSRRLWPALLGMNRTTNRWWHDPLQSSQVLPLLQMLRQHQEGEAAALRTLQKVQEDRRLLQERLGGLQRALAQLESEKRETERSSLRLEKDKNALKKTLDKVSWVGHTYPQQPGPPHLKAALPRKAPPSRGSPGVCTEEGRLCSGWQCPMQEWSVELLATESWKWFFCENR